MQDQMRMRYCFSVGIEQEGVAAAGCCMVIVHATYKKRKEAVAAEIELLEEI